jgi:hypothetical protein
MVSLKPRLSMTRPTIGVQTMSSKREKIYKREILLAK